MSAPATKEIPSELAVELPGQKTRRISMVALRYRLGRSPQNELAFPEDSRLSREHLVFERIDGRWTVQDSGSSNGTRLNGAPLTQAVVLADGDRITAGNTVLVFNDPKVETPARDTVVFFNDPDPGLLESKTTVTHLHDAMDPQATSGEYQNKHLDAVLRAARELAAYCAIGRLFDLVVELSVTVVGASRGLLVALEGGALNVRSCHGEYFSVSTTVRDRVLNGESVLIRDAWLSDGLAQSRSIVAQQVRSLIAVPLQTEGRVIGFIYVDSPQQVRKFTPEDLNLLTVLANIAAIRIEHARLLEVEQAERQLARELDQAAEIQQRLLPAQPPQLEGFDLAGHNVSCRKVGGDYYDFWRHPDGRLYFLVADVSGKGMPAALMMSNLQACTHAIFLDPDQLSTAVASLNRATALSTPANCFVTFFVAVLDPATGQITYCNAGHNPPVLLRGAGEIERLDATGIVLGLLPDAEYQVEKCRLDPEDMLLLFSDGVTEACGAKDDIEYGEDRLIAALRKEKGKPAASILQAIAAELSAYIAGSLPADDVTLALIRRT